MSTDPRRLTLLERVIRGLNRACIDVAGHAKQESYGSDGVPLRQFLAQWKQEKAKVSRELREGAYKFRPLRGVVLPKEPGKPLSAQNARPISVPAIRDRVVQRSI